MKVDEIIADADVVRVHGSADFGSMTPREVIAEGVLKYAYGYTSGHTQLMILLEHGLIYKPKPGSYQSTLTKRGRSYLRAAYPYDKFVAARQAPEDVVEALAAWLFDRDEGCGPQALSHQNQPQHWRVEYEAAARAFLAAHWPVDVEAAVKAEREACAKIADDRMISHLPACCDEDELRSDEACEIAAAILARRG